MAPKTKSGLLASIGLKNSKRAKTRKFFHNRIDEDPYGTSSDEDFAVEKSHPIDPWHGTTDDFDQNLSLNHPYSGSNYGRFETTLKPLNPLDSIHGRFAMPKRRSLHPAERSSQRRASQHSAPIGFMDLPKEIRLMIYECLTTRTRHELIKKEYTYKVNKKTHRGQISCTMVTQSVPGISILSTCKTISDEAWPILLPLLNDVTYKPPKIILDARYAAETVASPASPIAAIVGYYSALKERPLLTYKEFLFEAEEAFDPWPNAYEASLLNNGYYEDYPFHKYSWMFDDNKFRNSVKKLAHQLVSEDRSRSQNNLKFEIALVNKSGLTASELDTATEKLHEALCWWFLSTRVKFFVQSVSDDVAPGQYIRPTFVWPVGRTDHESKVVWWGCIDKEEWEECWAEREGFL